MIIKGSSKDILIEVKPSNDKMGVGYFIPKDTFSIFDYKNYGEWPFTIPYKGLGMAFIINRSYELAREANIKTCFLEGLRDRSKVRLARVPGREIPLEQDKIPIGTKNRMIDLEIIFNSYLHPRSSLFKAFTNKSKDYREYGFNDIPQPFEKIPNMILSYTTKYDKRGDIPLDDKQAIIRSRLNEDQWINAMNAIRQCIEKISEYAKSKNLLRIDGKYEILVDDNNDILIADTFGNPEEDRYIYRIKDFTLIERLFHTYAKRLELNDTKIDFIIRSISNREHYYQDISKQFLRNWYIDNSWKSLFDKDKSIKPYNMPIYAIEAYSNAIITFASIWSGKGNEISDLTKRMIKPIDEVAAELFVLEELNRNNIIKLS